MCVKNPFISFDEESNSEYLSNICSINKAIVKKLPLYGIADEIEGKSAIEIFSARVISDEILKNADRLGIAINKGSEKGMPKYLNKCLESENPSVRSHAKLIADKFGDRLALVLLMLRVGDKENRAVRKDWEDRHWQFWANVNNIILLGGLASGKLGECFKESIINIFKRYKGISIPNIMLSDSSANAGIMGAAQLLTCLNGKCLVFDLGQTNIKRSIVTRRNGTIVSVEVLPPLVSEYVETQNKDNREKNIRAQLLHSYIVNAVCNTVTKVSERVELCDEIVVSIANYTVNGRLDGTRGGYAKLTALGDNYRSILSSNINAALGRTIKLTTVHDGTAMALSFSGIDNSVCVSLGTAFGVGFPDLKALL